MLLVRDFVGCAFGRYDGAPLALLAEWFRILGFKVDLVSSGLGSATKVGCIRVRVLRKVVKRMAMTLGAANIKEDTFRADAGP